MYTLNASQKNHPLPEGEVLKIGRSPSSDIVCEDADASRHHGELKVEGGQLSYRDLESTNGSRLNGQIISPWNWHILGVGDTLEIGKWLASVANDEKTVEVKRDAIPTPSVDPSAPQHTFEATKARVIPDELRQK